MHCDALGGSHRHRRRIADRARELAYNPRVTPAFPALYASQDAPGPLTEFRSISENNESRKSSASIAPRSWSAMLQSVLPSCFWFVSVKGVFFLCD